MAAPTQLLLPHKRQLRQTLAQLSFLEKVRIVEKLRDPSNCIAQAAQGQRMR